MAGREVFAERRRGCWGWGPKCLILLLKKGCFSGAHVAVWEHSPKHDTALSCHIAGYVSEMIYIPRTLICQ